MKAVVNASPLIFLAKLARLDLLPDPCFTTPQVLAEVETGSMQSHVEAAAVDAHVKGGRLVVKSARPAPLGARTGLHPGEASVLQLAVDEGVARVIVDDYAAIRAAKLLGLRPVSTVFLLLEARRGGQLDQQNYRRLLERLMAHRYYISAAMFQRLLEAGERET